VLDRATALAAENPGWRVERALRLGTFSFVDFDLWRDLSLRETEPVSAPLAWLLGLEQPPALGLGAGAAKDLIVPLDADASQLAAIAAATAGKSFVLQGPPGTGKSQTIANLAVQCASQGTSVLVVSDRASALETVQLRLAGVGLGDFCTVAGEPAPRATR